MKSRDVLSETVLDGKVQYRLVRLTFGPEEKLSLNAGIFTPAQSGEFPAITDFLIFFSPSLSII